MQCNYRLFCASSARCLRIQRSKSTKVIKAHLQFRKTSVSQADQAHRYSLPIIVREKVEDGQVILEYISTFDMLADIMTKTISATQICALRGKLEIQGPKAVA